MGSDGAGRDAAFGDGARVHRFARRAGVTAAVGFCVSIGLAVWLGSISDVNDTSSQGRAGAVETLAVRIPQLAVVPGRDDAQVAVVGARVYLVVAVVALLAAAAGGVAWLRADRLRKPLSPPPAGRHRRRP